LFILEEFPVSQYTETQPTHPTADISQTRNSLASYASLRPRPKTNIEQSISLIGYHPNGQTTNNSGFYDTNANNIITALSNYNNNRNSPPRSSGYEVPNNRTFHSASNSVSTASPRNSLEHAINPATQELIASTTSTAAVVQPSNESSPPKFLTLSTNENPPAETYSIL
jgi:hypothetical protein